MFLTGATGYVGGAVAFALRKAGHDVAALVRPDSEARALRDAGVVIVAGDLAQLPSLGSALAGCDVLIHTAMAQGSNSVALDRIAVDVFTAQQGAHVLYTSGVWVLDGIIDADEKTPPKPIALVAWRPPHERLVLDAGGAVIRPGCVYGGRQSLLTQWFEAADAGRPLEIAGDGRNRWAMVHLSDLADCYVKAAEQRAAGIFHGVDDTHDALNDCARAVSHDAPIEHVDPPPGPFAEALLIDQVVLSEGTRERLGWRPRRTFTSSIEEQWQEWREERGRLAR
jgi:nucleoside-diphosphate-sugar epimerase